LLLAIEKGGILSDGQYARYREREACRKSFQAGKKEGIRELVGDFKCDDCSTPNFIHLVIPNSKLREWGIKDGE